MKAIVYASSVPEEDRLLTSCDMETTIFNMQLMHILEVLYVTMSVDTIYCIQIAIHWISGIMLFTVTSGLHLTMTFQNDPQPISAPSPPFGIDNSRYAKKHLQLCLKCHTGSMENSLPRGLCGPTCAQMKIVRTTGPCTKRTLLFSPS